MNKILIGIIVILVVGGIGAYFLTKGNNSTYEVDVPAAVSEKSIAVENDNGAEDEAGLLDETLEPEVGPVEVIGSSVEGRDIRAYHFGEGEREVLFIGGTHGGYSWNTSLVAYELIDYLKEDASRVPQDVKVTIIPAVNPDGLFNVIGKEGSFSKSDVSGSDPARVAARFNANEVDLNRNFNCLWEETGIWQSRSVSGGSAPFSEPESVAVRDYVGSHDLSAVVVYYAAAGGVYASNCKTGMLTETLELTNVYADASGYTANEEFDFYEVTGDMVNWLAAKKIPAISVLLTTRESSEWSKNKAGIDAILKNIAK